MNWLLFTNELKKQLKSAKIPGTTLSKNIDKHTSYVSQILSGKIQKVDYATATNIFSSLGLISPEYMNTYLIHLGIPVPSSLVDNDQLLTTQLEQCYKDFSWEEYEKKELDRMSSEFNEREEYKEELYKEAQQHPIKKRNELSQGITKVNNVLLKFLEKTFSVKDYEKKHRAEAPLTTLIGLVTDNEGFPIFEKLFSIPLHRLNPDELQKVLDYAQKICKYEYHFVSGNENEDEENTNFLEELANYPQLKLRYKPEQSLKDWESLGQESNEDSKD